MTTQVWEGKRRNRMHALVYLMFVIGACIGLFSFWRWVITNQPSQGGTKGVIEFLVIFAMAIISPLVWFKFGEQATDTMDGIPDGRFGISCAIPNPLHALGALYLIPVLIIRFFDGRYLVL